MTPRPSERVIARVSPRFYVGWSMVGLAFGLGFLSNAFYAYSRGIWLPPLSAELGGDRFQVSLAFSLVSIVAALSAPWVGGLFDRLPVRRVLVGAAFWLGLGYILLAQIESLLGLYAVMAVFLGLASLPLGDAGPAKLVVNWFRSRRGLALSITAMGASTAGILAPPVIAGLIEVVGWRGLFMVFGAVLLLFVMPVLADFIRNDPAAAGVEPDPAPAGDFDGDDERAWLRREVLRSSDFWGIVVVFGVMLATFGATSTHLFAHMTDIGHAPGRAAVVLSSMAAAALLAKPLFGVMIDRFDPRLAVGMAVACQGCALAMLLVVEAFVPLMVTALLFGLGYGGMVPLRNAITALSFGRASFGSVSGTLRPFQLPLVVAAIPFAGWVFDRFGNYDLAFGLFCALQGVSGFAILLLSRAAARSARLRGVVSGN